MMDSAVESGERQRDPPVTVCLLGDVMTGRGIDQILPHPGDPALHEPLVQSALGYVALAEQANGALPRPVDFAYIWGDMLDVLASGGSADGPDVRIANLETAITTSDAYWRGKAPHYRMHPANTPCLAAAGLDCCAVANNHVLDWGYEGLRETATQLDQAGIHRVGAGAHADEAAAPARIPVPGRGHVLVFALGSPSSGIPTEWAASAARPGVNLVRNLPDEAVRTLARRVRKVKQAGDIAVASLHWGSNWGYDIPRSHCDFARRLIDLADIDVVYGHSSHHVRGIEVYQDKLILYGCGDFLDDYEGIGGHKEFRPDLGAVYLASLERASGRLLRLKMLPTQVRRMCVRHAYPADVQWLQETLNAQGKQFGSHVQLCQDNSLLLQWQV